MWRRRWVTVVTNFVKNGTKVIKEKNNIAVSFSVLLRILLLLKVIILDLVIRKLFKLSSDRVYETHNVSTVFREKSILEQNQGPLISCKSSFIWNLIVFYFLWVWLGFFYPVILIGLKHCADFSTSLEVELKFVSCWRDIYAWPHPVLASSSNWLVVILGLLFRVAFIKECH